MGDGNVMDLTAKLRARARTHNQKRNERFHNFGVDGCSGYGLVRGHAIFPALLPADARWKN